MLDKDRAVCIRTVDYSETSQIVTFLTRAKGKLTTIAKGSKRPKSAFEGTIEMFAAGEIVFAVTDKEKLATLVEFQQQASYTGVRNDLLSLNCALFAGELVNSLIDDYDPHPGLFDFFIQFLKHISRSQNKTETLSLLIVFQLTLLNQIGLQPVLDRCSNCSSKFRQDWSEIYFSSSANGFICRDCGAGFPDKIRLTPQAAACMSKPKLFTKANEKTIKHIEKVLVAHFSCLLGRRPKMAKYISP